MPADAPIPPGVATVPSVTQYSRTSCSRGGLTSGAAADEKRASKRSIARPSEQDAVSSGFSTKASCRSLAVARWPNLFAQRLRPPDRRIVAAVVNAVDDYLAKADQVRPRWSLEHHLLRPCCMKREWPDGSWCSCDHGHLLDDETRTSGMISVIAGAVTIRG